jgi:hypothetical protein
VKWDNQKETKQKQINQKKQQTGAQLAHKHSPLEKTMDKAVIDSMQDNEKTATNNQWVSTGLSHFPDNRERRDGPGGEDADS